MPKTTLTQPVFNVHSLLFGIETDGKAVQTIAQQLKALQQPPGYFGLEVAFHPNMIDINDGHELGAVCVAEQLPITALCVFFGDKDVDPLADPQSALIRLGRAHQMAVDIGAVTGITPVITGPWAYQIGRRYPRTDETATRVRRFIHEVDTAFASRFPKVRRALEVLRPPENHAVQGHAELAEALLGTHPNTGAHIDTFHVNLWGDDVQPAVIFDMFLRKLFWFHVSGQDRRTPGSHPLECINWGAWANAYNSSAVKPPICFEGFGPKFRDAVPEIGKGFPKDLSPIESIRVTLETLRKAGFQI